MFNANEIDTSLGYVKLHRDLFNNFEYQDPNVFLVYLVCLMSANHAPAFWNGEKIEKGQFVTSRDKLASKCNLTVQRVRTALKKLQRSGYISLKTTSKNTVITLCYYSHLQGKGEDVNRQITGFQPGTNRQLTANNNEKEEKRMKKKDIYSPEFNEIWNLYPRKSGKYKANSAYQKAVSQGTSPGEIKRGVIKYGEYIKKNKVEPRYIAQGSTWFNQRRWEDDYENPNVIHELDEIF